MKASLKFLCKNLLVFFLISVLFSPTIIANELNNTTVVIVPNAGSDNVNNQLCEALSVDVFHSKNSLEAYFLDLLDQGVDRTGKFNPPIPKILSDYSKMALGIFETTYSIRNGNNVDTALLAVTVINNPQAGIDNISSLSCYSDISITLSNLNNATAYFNSLIEVNADSNGTFSPPIQTLVNNFNSYPVGTFQTEYIVTAGGCEDSATLLITMEDGSYAGKDNTNNTMTRTEASNRFKNLNDVKTYYLSLLSSGVSKDGTFDNRNLQLLATQYTQNPIGTFKTVYTGTSGGCSDSAVLSLTIVEDANKTRASTSKAQISSLIDSSSLVIYNLSGGVVKTSKVDATETFNKNSSTFSDSNLKRGIYIYKLNDGNDVISTKKIIVE